jgi:hypothetical protein
MVKRGRRAVMPSITSSCDLAISSEPEEDIEMGVAVGLAEESEDEADAVCLYCAAFFSEDYDDEGVDAKNV